MSDPSPQPATYVQRALKWTIFLGTTAVVVYLCLQILGPFLNVLAWSLVLAVAFYPVHTRLVRKTGRVSLSALITSALVVITVVIPFLFITAVAINQFLGLRDYLQQSWTAEGGFGIVEPLRRASEWLTSRFGLNVGTIADWVRQHASDLTGVVAEYSLSIAASITGAVVSFIFIIFAVFLLFRDGERMVAKIPDLLPFERTRSEALLARIRDAVYGGVYGVLVIAFIQGALTGGMFWLLGIPSAALWAMVTALTGVLPLVGSAAVWGPGALYLALTGHWAKAVILLVWGGVVISSIDNFLRPKLVGGRVGVSELAIFFALLGGLQVFGVLGIVLGPVLFTVLASIVEVLSDESAVPADGGPPPRPLEPRRERPLP